MGFFDNDIFDFNQDGVASRDEEVFAMMMFDDYEREMKKESSLYEDEDEDDDWF